MLHECVVDSIVEELKGNGYRICECHRRSGQGVDIIAERNGCELYVECQGDEGGREASLRGNLGKVITQILKRMTSDQRDYALAFSHVYKKYVCEDEIPGHAWKNRLRLKFVAVVDVDCRVKYLIGGP